MEGRHFREIVKRLSNSIAIDGLEKLPSSYELVGDIMLLQIPDDLKPYKRLIAETYMDVIGVGGVMEKERISGELREPGHRLLAGERTVTLHKENGINYSIDLSRLMFSSGNINERIRMSKVKNIGPVVDMFAGIGYFSLPIAKYSRSSVVALEKNPISFQYLEENIRLNNLSDLITAENMDCRDYEGTGVKRIVMGYVRSTEKYLDKAMDIAGDGCIVHYHQTVPSDRHVEEMTRDVTEAARRGSVGVDILDIRQVKKYSPGIIHAVCDFEIKRY
ncbi:MAG: class I SAM-dependent methyltransferase family protein [Candidatus Methanofastidiosa archaeon]|nr:class I SAM-dependent methyltransferase family protein [Candidatus Methanofastidiosa archaeon]